MMMVVRGQTGPCWRLPLIGRVVVVAIAIALTSALTRLDPCRSYTAICVSELGLGGPGSLHTLFRHPWRHSYVDNEWRVPEGEEFVWRVLHRAELSIGQAKLNRHATPSVAYVCV